MAFVLGFYCLHNVLFYVFQIKFSAFYTLNELYLLFAMLSFIIIVILIKIKQKNIDNVGSSFLLITSIKLIAVFVFGNAIMRNQNLNHSIEKWNFLGLFLLFLAIETLVTIQMLNKK
jgi:hypothetical protein